MKARNDRLRRGSVVRQGCLCQARFCPAVRLLLIVALGLPAYGSVGAEQGNAQPQPSQAQGTSTSSLQRLFDPMPDFDVDRKEDVAMDFYVCGYLQDTP